MVDAVLSIWSWDNLTNGLIAVAILGQVWIGYRIYLLERSRSKVTVFASLDSEGRQRGARRAVVPILRIGNLSHVGIWLYSCRIVATVNGHETKTSDRPLNYALAPFSPHEIEADGLIKAAMGQILTGPWPEQIRATVDVEISYWGAGRQAAKRIERLSVICDQGRDFWIDITPG